MLTNDCCPQCGRQADSGRVRLVQDSCGHRKCRECLLSDEAGCLLCSCNPEYLELASIQTTPSEPEAISELIAGPSTPFEDIRVADSLPEGTSTSPDNSPVCLKDLQTSVTFDEKNFKNSSFDKSEENSEPLTSHDKNVTIKKTPTVGLKEHIIFTPGNPPKYTCKKCDKSYNNRKAARYHNFCGAPNAEKPHTCDECGQGFVTKGHLAYHTKSHTGSLPFTCKLCGKGFKQLSKLNRHSKSHEGTCEKPFKCELCEKAFSTKQILKDHKLSHTEGHFVTCPICNKKLSSPSCLRKHKKLHADLTHKCKDCGKKFPVKWSLEVHMKTHQRERKFKCKECPRAFKIHSDLKRHAFVHQDDGEWECKTCTLIFRRRDNLVRHLKNIHPEAPLIVSTKKRNDKSVEEAEDEPEKCEESHAKSSPTVSQAVSVIRAVPVIQKAETVLDSDQSKGGTSQIRNQEKSKDEASVSFNSVQPTLHQDLNFQRESVVRHSDSRGVVHCGSSYFESMHDTNNTKKISNNASPKLCHVNDQVQEHEDDIASGCQGNIVQSYAVQRPQVIVAKETCL